MVRHRPQHLPVTASDWAFGCSSSAKGRGWLGLLSSAATLFTASPFFIHGPLPLLALSSSLSLSGLRLQALLIS